MVEVEYTYPKKEVYTSEDELSFFLTNKHGDFLFQGIDTLFSHYNGLFLQYETDDGWTPYKILSTILSPGLKANKVSTDFASTTISYEQGSLTYSMHENCVLQIKVHNYTGKIPILLDCRDIYENPSMGRHFSFEDLDDILLITYSGPNTLKNGKEEVVYIAITKSMPFEYVQQWVKIENRLEIKRNAQPKESFLYEAIKFDASFPTKLKICAGFEKDDVIANVKKSLSDTTHYKHALLDETDVSFTAALNSVDDLLVKPTSHKGLFAGLPWFFEYWTRDEAISLGALIVQGRYDDVKTILLRHFQTIGKDGRNANRFPHSDLGSADGIGWSCKRLYDLLNSISVAEYFTHKELISVRSAIVLSVERLTQTYMDDFVFNKPLETWMDTGNPYDVRDGFRIEIQALFLIQLRTVVLLNQILNDGKFIEYRILESDFAKKVEQVFFTTTLIDGLNADKSLDETIRPNVFLAHYIYPWLLEEDQWEATFDSALQALYLSWGGLSTIDKANSLFKEMYTGNTNESYHRGDSWFWVNNMGAYCLAKVNPQKYAPVITKIQEASKKEMLTLGSIGRSAEVSDAKDLSSHGCFMQLWSSALYVELCNEIK